jgi:predicted nucleotidyltransferase
MGRVYTTEQVFETGLPNPGAHEHAADELIKRIADDGEVSGAMIYGSTAQGRATLRSDVDVLVTYPSGEAAGILPHLRYIFKSVESAHHVVVEPHAIDSQSIANPVRHNIDPLFAKELWNAWRQGAWVFGDPLGNLKTFELTDKRVRTTAMAYASAKERQFTKSLLAFDGHADNMAMQRALELPAAIGRKVIAATNVLGEVDYDVVDKAQMRSLTKQRLKKLFEFSTGQIDWTGSPDPVKNLEELEKIDERYDKILKAADNTWMTSAAYQDWLDSHYESTVSLARSYAYDWSELIRQIPFINFDDEDPLWDPGEEPPFDDLYDDLPPDDVY